MLRGVSLCLAVVGAVAIPATGFAQAQGSEQYRLRVEVLYGEPNLTGTIQKGFGEEEGDVIDLVQDLGVGSDSEWTFKGNLRLSESVKLRGSYMAIDFTGDKRLERNFSFGDESFYLGTQVQTSVLGSLYSGDIEYDFVRKPGVFFGALLGVRVFDVSSLLAAPAEGQRVTQEGLAPVPVIGVIGRYYLGKRLSAEAEFAGMTIGSRGKSYDLGVSARFHLSDRMAASVAYRKLMLKGENDRDSGDILHTAWNFGLELSL